MEKNSQTVKDICIGANIYRISEKKPDFLINLEKTEIKIDKIKKMTMSIVNGQTIVGIYVGNKEEDNIIAPASRKINEEVTGIETIYTDTDLVKKIYQAKVQEELQELQQLENYINLRRDEIKNEYQKI